MPNRNLWLILCQLCLSFWSASNAVEVLQKPSPTGLTGTRATIELIRGFLKRIGQPKFGLIEFSVFDKRATENRARNVFEREVTSQAQLVGQRHS